jgi:hypothetical protein
LRRTHLIPYAAKDAGPRRLREDALRSDSNEAVVPFTMQPPLPAFFSVDFEVIDIY